MKKSCSILIRSKSKPDLYVKIDAWINGHNAIVTQIIEYEVVDDCAAIIVYTPV